MQHDPLALAYIAGVIDSDGYITIHRSSRQKSGVYHAATLGIAGTSTEPHELAVSLWGGKIWRHIPKIGKAQYQWARTGDCAVPILAALHPHLRIKKRNAELAMDLQQHVQCGRGSYPFPWMNRFYNPIPEREEMRHEMMLLLNTRTKASAVLDGKEHYNFPISAGVTA